MISDLGELFYDKEEPIDQVITWVYEEGRFVPIAKIIGEEKFSIVSDYIGRPIQVYNSDGGKLWETDYDIYGRVRNLQGDKTFIPFRQLGQYEDEELGGLYYNRFKYYYSSSGTYISQDPIGLAGNNLNFYAYSKDINIFVDLFGLDCGKVKRARTRQQKMLDDNVGYNISPTDWDHYPTIGRNGSFLTDKSGALKYFRDIIPGSTRTIRKKTASRIEADMELEPGSLGDGFKIRKINDIIDMAPRSPLEGNRFFAGPGQHLPGGAPELVVNSIPTVDNAEVTTILNVIVK